MKKSMSTCIVVTVEQKEYKKHITGIHKIMEYIILDFGGCKKCGMCCLDDAPSLYPHEIRKLSQHVKMNPEEFKQVYTKEAGPPERPGTRKMTIPCPFLKDNKCSIYSIRPEICISYPFVLTKILPSSYHIIFTAKQECDLAQQIIAAYSYFCKQTGRKGYIDLNIHTKEYKGQRKQQGLKPLKHGDRCVSIEPHTLTLFLGEIIKALENKSKILKFV